MRVILCFSVNGGEYLTSLYIKRTLPVRYDWNRQLQGVTKPWRAKWPICCSSYEPAFVSYRHVAAIIARFIFTVGHWITKKHFNYFEWSFKLLSIFGDTFQLSAPLMRENAHSLSVAYHATFYFRGHQSSKDASWEGYRSRTVAPLWKGGISIEVCYETMNPIQFIYSSHCKNH